MGRFWRGSLAAVSVLAALAAVAAALIGQGLDRAEKWMSIAGVLLSVIFGAAGVLLGWLHWRHSKDATKPPPTTAADGAGAAAGTVSEGRAGPTHALDLRHARGVQIGDGNTQENTFSD